MQGIFPGMKEWIKPGITIAMIFVMLLCLMLAMTSESYTAVRYLAVVLIFACLMGQEIG